VAQNFELLSNIQDQNQKLKKYSLSNGTTLMQVQSGRTVPLKVCADGFEGIFYS
jgi:hypothetical protein